MTQKDSDQTENENLKCRSRDIFIFKSGKGNSCRFRLTTSHGIKESKIDAMCMCKYNTLY